MDHDIDDSSSWIARATGAFPDQYESYLALYIDEAGSPEVSSWFVKTSSVDERHTKHWRNTHQSCVTFHPSCRPVAGLGVKLVINNLYAMHEYLERDKRSPHQYHRFAPHQYYRYVDIINVNDAIS